MQQLSKQDIPLNLNDYQKLAKKQLPLPLYEYIASGTEDEQTLFENRAAFKNWYLRPRMMKPVGNLNTSIQLFGQVLSMPVFVSPAGVQALCDPDGGGECTTARACSDIGILYGLSQHSTRSIEQVSAAAPYSNLWYQAYILNDRKRTLRLISRAIRAGYKGIFLTVDSIQFGYREADDRNNFNALPYPHRLANYDDDDDDDGGGSTSNFDKVYNAKEKNAWDQNTEQLFDKNVSWDDIKWVKENCSNLPLVIKGIMTAEDTELAIQAGADGVMVSNHGGRQLDGALSTIDVLPEVVKAANGRVPVLIDGGFRRGTDVVKALALGASAVGIGKPIYFSLAIGGHQGVVSMLKMLKSEIESTMALCGTQTVNDITSNLVTRHPSGASLVPYLRASL